MEAGLTFTLCVPLNATKFDSFIVGMEKYRQSADLNLQVEDSFHVQHSVVANGESHAVRQVEVCHLASCYSLADTTFDFCCLDRALL